MGLIFNIENLGAIKEANVELGNLTVIAGKNNTGKTFLTYAIWGVLARQLTYATGGESISQNSREKYELLPLLNQGKTIELDIKNLEQDFKNKFQRDIYEYGKQMKKIFNVEESNIFNNIKMAVSTEKYNFKYTEEFFGQVHFSISSHKGKGIFYYKQKINSSIFECNLKKEGDYEFDIDAFDRAKDFIRLSFFPFFPFILTAQRDAIFLFKNAINRHNQDLVRNFKYKDISQEIDNYAMPLAENINYASGLDDLTKWNSFLYKENPGLFEEIENFLGVKYEIQNGSFVIIDKKNNNIVPHYLASASVRVMANLYFYLKHNVQKGELIMIDEPEQNLHPENQIKLARLFVKLVNAGVKVWITTHSDYIVKALNNALMLSNDIPNKDEFLAELGYKQNDILKKEDLAYHTAYYSEELGGCTIERPEIGKYGITKSSFDDTLDNIVAISNKIFDKLDDQD